MRCSLHTITNTKTNAIVNVNVNKNAEKDMYIRLNVMREFTFIQPVHSYFNRAGN